MQSVLRLGLVGALGSRAQAVDAPFLQVVHRALLRVWRPLLGLSPRHGRLVASLCTYETLRRRVWAVTLSPGTLGKRLKRWLFWAF